MEVHVSGQQTGTASPVRQSLAHRAARIRSGDESAFFQLLRLAEGREGIITLGRGEPDIPTPAHIVEAAKRALDDGYTTYTNPAGMPALREAIAEKFERDAGLRYNPSNEIIVTSGAQEAIAVTMQTLLDPGDEVLLASPYYNAYEANIILAGGEPAPVKTRKSDDFQMMPAAIEERITARTKLLALVSPNNPSAAALEPETVKEIAALAVRRNLTVLWDELYEKVTYDGFQHLNIATLPGMRERTIVVNGFSKAYSMTGFRVGYMAGPADYIRAAVEPRHSLSICTPTMSQHAALAALTGPQEFLAEMVQEYTKRRNLMATAFDEVGVGYALPKGAFYFWADIGDLGISSFEFCKRGIVDHNILFFPGSMYGADWDRYIRISYLAPPDQLMEGLARFKALHRACQGAA
jgi:aminotransferase